MPRMRVFCEDGRTEWFEEVDRGAVDGLGRVRRTRGVLVTLELPDGAPPEPGDRR
ncbi:hypothetical protein ABT288_09660 [Streptomyces sp. NPDC001093]|uniref:hypothetical protein n=1 Tax=Streptomyces sp. NPDC001093 TaxID=3154376 RepID=UPI0033269857